VGSGLPAVVLQQHLGVPAVTFVRFIARVDIVMAVVFMPVAMQARELFWVHVFGLIALLAFLMILLSHRLDDHFDEDTERQMRDTVAGRCDR
jgi:ABC-type enterochelin transport system permease subunit